MDEYQSTNLADSLRELRATSDELASNTEYLFIQDTRDCLPYTDDWSGGYAYTGYEMRMMGDFNDLRSSDPIMKSSITNNVCSVGEVNAFAITQAPIILIKSCLTYNGQANYDSEVRSCMVSGLSQMGVPSLTVGCIDCLYLYIDMINSIPSRGLRNACIHSPISSTECLSDIDITPFISCSGFDPRNPGLKPYCTQKENRNAIGWSFYRTVMVTCLEVATSESDMSKCMNFVANSSGDMNSSSGDCLECWNMLMKAAYALPMDTKLVCSINPTSDQCVEALIVDLVSFITCSGMHPIETDFEFIASLQSTFGKSAAALGSRLIWLSIISVSMVILLF